MARVSFSRTPCPPRCPVSCPGHLAGAQGPGREGRWEGRVGGPCGLRLRETPWCGSGLAVWMEGPGEVVGFLRLPSDVLPPEPQMAVAAECPPRLLAVSWASITFLPSPPTLALGDPLYRPGGGGSEGQQTPLGRMADRVPSLGVCWFHSLSALTPPARLPRGW